MRVWYPRPCFLNQVRTSESRRMETAFFAWGIRTLAVLKNSASSSGMSLKSISASDIFSRRSQSVRDSVVEVSAFMMCRSPGGDDSDCFFVVPLNVDHDRNRDVEQPHADPAVFAIVMSSVESYEHRTFEHLRNVRKVDPVLRDVLVSLALVPFDFHVTMYVQVVDRSSRIFRRQRYDEGLGGAQRSQVPLHRLVGTVFSVVQHLLHNHLEDVADLLELFISCAEARLYDFVDRGR